MTEHLLHVSASPRGERSLSKRIAEGFVRVRVAQGDTEVIMECLEAPDP